MPSAGPYPRLWQAKVPILMACAVVLLIVLTLRANDQRECKAVCVKHGFVDGIYAREWFSAGACKCVTPAGTQVPAPQPAR